MSRRLLVLLIAAVVVLTTGCIKVDVAIDVNDDGSGAIRTVQAVDVDALAQSGVGDFEPGDLVPDRGNLPDQVTASRYREDGYEGVELRADFADLDELDSRLQDMADAFVATFEAGGSEPSTGAEPPPGDSLAGFRIGRTLDGWTFVGEGVARELGSPDVRALAGGAALRLEVRLPGRPVLGRNNADEVDGNRFVWRLGLGDTRDELFAETGPGSPDSSDGRWLWGGLMVGFAAVATLAVVWLARRHHRSRVPRPPKPPRPTPRPSAPAPAEVELVDASGWPRRPPPHPPLLPPDPWSSGAGYDLPTGAGHHPPPGWPPGRSPGDVGGPGVLTGTAATGGPVRIAPEPAAAAGGAPRPEVAAGAVAVGVDPGTSVEADPTANAPITPNAEPPGPVPGPAPWRPPPGWPQLHPAPPGPAGPGGAASLAAPPAGAADPTGLALPPRRPTDLPPPPDSRHG